MKKKIIWFMLELKAAAIISRLLQVPIITAEQKRKDK